MSNVNLVIGNRTFTVSAADGEEAHIEMLGRMIADRVDQSGAANQSEPRMLLFAALVLADELHDAHRQQPPPTAAAAAPTPVEAQPSAKVVARVEALATLVEKLAASLEETAADA